MQCTGAPQEHCERRADGEPGGSGGRLSRFRSIAQLGGGARWQGIRGGILDDFGVVLVLGSKFITHNRVIIVCDHHREAEHTQYDVGEASGPS